MLQKKGNHGPNFVVTLLRRPGRHAGEFDAVLDYVKQLIGLPFGNCRRQMGRMRRHLAGDDRLRQIRAAVARPATEVVVSGAFYDQTQVVEPRRLGADGMHDHRSLHGKV